PAHLAPEAGALSAELLGHRRARRGAKAPGQTTILSEPRHRLRRVAVGAGGAGPVTPRACPILHAMPLRHRSGRGATEPPAGDQDVSGGQDVSAETSAVRPAPQAEPDGPAEPAALAASTGPLQRDLLPDTAEVGSDGRLRVGGVDLVELAERFGTPLFVYDEAHLRNRCRQAVAAWGDGVAYATKAFLCKAMARLAYDEGMALDVSTAGELAVALAAGVPADRLVFHGNNKSEAELARALDVEVGRIVVDSFDEIDRLGRLVENRPTDPHADPDGG